MMRALEIALDIWLASLLLTGCLFTLLGAVGLVKLSDFFRRIHAPAKASTLGVGCILLASIIYHAMYGAGLHPRELLITVFLFLTAPISAHLMSRAALSLMVDPPQPPPPDKAAPSTAAPRAGNTPASS